MKKLNNKGLFEPAGLIAITVLLIGLGAYMESEGKWGKNGTEAVHREPTWCEFRNDLGQIKVKPECRP